MMFVVDCFDMRYFEQVIEVVNKKPNLRKISFIAHSVGGLVARYAIGRLYRASRRDPLKKPSCGPYDGSHLGTIYSLEAMNFITVATPNLGSRGNKQVLLHIFAQFLIIIFFISLPKLLVSWLEIV